MWGLKSQNTATFPEGPFVAEASALKRLYYAVDSTWISHTFAVTFIVLSYVKGIVNGQSPIRDNVWVSHQTLTLSDELQICSLTSANSVQTTPHLPRANSVIARLVQLAVDIFDGICQSPTFHPARDYQSIVHSASLLVIAPARAPDWHAGQDMDNAAMQSLLDFMNDSGIEWTGNIFDPGTEYTASWEVDEILNH